MRHVLTLLIWAVAASFASAVEITPVLAQGEGVSEFTTKIGDFIKFILVPIGVVWGVIMIWTGANKGRNGDPEGWTGIIWGMVVAAAPLIIYWMMQLMGFTAGVEDMGIF